MTCNGERQLVKYGPKMHHLLNFQLRKTFSLFFIIIFHGTLHNLLVCSFVCLLLCYQPSPPPYCIPINLSSLLLSTLFSHILLPPHLQQDASTSTVKTQHLSVVYKYNPSSSNLYQLYNLNTYFIYIFFTFFILHSEL